MFAFVFCICLCIALAFIFTRCPYNGLVKPLVSTSYFFDMTQPSSGWLSLSLISLTHPSSGWLICCVYCIYIIYTLMLHVIKIKNKNPSSGWLGLRLPCQHVGRVGGVRQLCHRCFHPTGGQRDRGIGLQSSPSHPVLLPSTFTQP